MSLLTDGIIAQLADLTEYESSIRDVASTEGIDLWAKLSVARLEISLGIQKFLLEQQDGSFSINNVLVTEGLKQWHILQTLSVIYRDAYHQQLNDRYKGKWKEYSDLANSAASVYFSIGVAIALRPVSRPGGPVLGQTVGDQQAMTWYVQTSWLNPRGDESAPSTMNSFSTQEESALTVEALNAPQGVTGWNVYLGLSSESMFRQNASPLSLGQKWVMPGSLVTNGYFAAVVQAPDTFVRKRNLLRRG